MTKIVEYVLQHLVMGLFIVYLAIGILFRHSLFGSNEQPIVQKTETDSVAAQQGVQKSSVTTSPESTQLEDKSYQFRPVQQPTEKVVPASPNFEEILKLARTALKIGDDESAIGYYQSAIRNFNNRPEPFGELGNLYLKAGDMEKAAAAYYEAGVRIPSDSDRLTGLLRVLEKISPDTAIRLKNKIKQN